MNKAVNAEFEAYYRLGALHYAGIADYTISTKLYKANFKEELSKKHLDLEHGYDLSNEQLPFYIDAAVKAYHATISNILEQEGVQLKLFEGSPGLDLEMIIADNRVRKDYGFGELYRK